MRRRLCRDMERETDSNPRLRPWQGRTLPLSYSRSADTFTYASRPPRQSISRHPLSLDPTAPFLYMVNPGRRSQVVKAEVCKTSTLRFKSGRASINPRCPATPDAHRQSKSAPRIPEQLRTFVAEVAHAIVGRSQTACSPGVHRSRRRWIACRPASWGAGLGHAMQRERGRRGHARALARSLRAAGGPRTDALAHFSTSCAPPWSLRRSDACPRPICLSLSRPLTEGRRRVPPGGSACSDKCNTHMTRRAIGLPRKDER